MEDCKEMEGLCSLPKLSNFKPKNKKDIKSINYCCSFTTFNWIRGLESTTFGTGCTSSIVGATLQPKYYRAVTGRTFPTSAL